MILPALLALQVAAGLLLRGCWDLWAQALILGCVLGGLGVWFVFRVAVGYVPSPSGRNVLWAFALALLGGCSTWASPLHALAWPEWLVMLGALWIFPAIAAISKDQRAWIDEAVRAAAWLLMALAFYQRYVEGVERPASALVSQNVYAGTLLLLLPLAVQKRDWLLALGLLCNLGWTRSVGAWLGLSAAWVLGQERRRPLSLALGWAVALICLIAIYNKFQSPEVLNRWRWWETALRLSLERPLLGYGPGAFSYLLPAYREPGSLGALYAHQYPLQLACEFGWPFTLLWFAGLWHCIGKGMSHKRFGVVALLTHSLWDWPLSVPANLWLFSYFAASSISEGSRGFCVPSRRKPWLALAAAALAATLGAGLWNFWLAQRAQARAAVLVSRGRLEEAAPLLEEALRRSPRDAQTRWLSAQWNLRRAFLGRDAAFFRAAARDLEEALALNPYRLSAWQELSRVYDALGDPAAAAAALERGRRLCPRLRS